MPNKNRGFILIVVLGVLGVLASLGILEARTGQMASHLTKTAVMRARARMLARSGVERGVMWTENRFKTDFLNPITNVSFDFSLDAARSFQGSDNTKVSVQDANGCINLNDGIRAGRTELGEAYNAASLDPYPSWGVTDDSAVINLRIRRLLNAYGDAWKFVSELDWPVWHIDDWEADVGNYGLAFDSTRTATFDRTLSIPAWNPIGPLTDPQTIAEEGTALGDVLISARPANGYRSLADTRDLIEAWATRTLPNGFIEDEGFFEMVQNDLTVEAWEDTSFPRLGRDVVPFGQIEKKKSTVTIDSIAHLDSEFPDLSSLWLPHSVSTINLNASSPLVRAAVFAAPVNVEYTAEGIHADLVELAGSHKVVSSRPWVSTVNAVLVKFKENGVPHPLGSTNTLMSMRDALVLAQGYGDYLSRGKIVDSFDGFRVFLEWMQLGRNTRGVANEAVFRKPTVLPVDTNNMLWWPTKILNGRFTSDYIHKTLPHILSANRRIPAWLGAPLALTSPLCTQSIAFDNKIKNYKGLSFVSVEDFVIRHTHPKVSFQPNGLVRIRSQATVRDGSMPVRAQVRMVSKHFDTVVLRSQTQMLDHTVPASSAASLKSSADILVGPTSSTMEANSYLGHVGLKDRTESPVGSTPLHYNAQFDSTLETTASPDLSGQPIARISSNNPDNWLGTVGTTRTYTPPAGIEYPLDLSVNYDPGLLQQIRQSPPAGQTFKYPSVQDSEALVMAFAAYVHSASTMFVNPPPPMPATLAEAMQFIITYQGYAVTFYDVPPNSPTDPDNFAWLISRLPSFGGWSAWAKSWHNGGPPTASAGHSAMSGADLEGPNVPFFGDPSLRTNLHPFGGLWLGEGHGPRAPQLFGDSLYLRPQDHASTSDPLGVDMAKGMLTFWVRIPSGMNGLVNRRSLFHATVWEHVELAQHDAVDPLHPTPTELEKFWRPVHLNCQLITTNVTRDGPPNSLPTFTPPYAVTFIKSQANVPMHQGLESPPYSNLRDPDLIPFPVGGNSLTGHYLGLAKSEIVDQPDWPTWFMQDAPNDARAPIGLVATADWVHMAPGSWIRIGLGWDFNELHESVKQRMWLRILSANDQSEYSQQLFTSCTQSIEPTQQSTLFKFTNDAVSLKNPLINYCDRSIIQFGEMPLYLHYARTEQTTPGVATPLATTIPEGLIPTMRLHSSIDNICLRLGSDGGPFRKHEGLGLLENTPEDFTRRYDIHSGHEPNWVLDPGWQEGHLLYGLSARIYDVPNLAHFSAVHRSLPETVNNPAIDMSLTDSSGNAIPSSWSSPLDYYGDPTEFFSDDSADWNDPRHGMPVKSKHFPRDNDSLPGFSLETQLYQDLPLTGTERIVVKWVARDPHGNPLKDKLTDIPYIQEIAWRVRRGRPTVIRWDQD